jgi:hypothetical protein
MEANTLEENENIPSSSRLESLDLLPFCFHVTDEQIESIAQKHQELKYIRIGGNRGFCRKGLSAIAQHCLRLEQLDVGGIKYIEPESVLDVVQNCVFHKKLNLEYCYSMDTNTILSILGCGKALEELNIEGCNKRVEIDFSKVFDYVARNPRERGLQITYGYMNKKVRVFSGTGIDVVEGR